MLRTIQNMRIGTKLAITSLLSVLLVGGMIFGQMSGNTATREGSEFEARLNVIVRNAVEAKAAVRGMMIGVRDIRLATSQKELQAAQDYLAARHKSAQQFIDDSLTLAKGVENQQRLRKMRELADEFTNRAVKEMVAVRSEGLSLGAKRSSTSELPVDVAARIAKLDGEVDRLAREVTLPITGDMETLANKVVELAKGRAEEEKAAVSQQMSATERNSLLIGLAVALVLAGACLFCVFTIARPITALTNAMRELAKGNLGVVLPGLGRKDEMVTLLTRSRRSRSKPRKRRATTHKLRSGRTKWPRPSAAWICTGWPTVSKPPSARSSTPYRLRPPNSRPMQAR